MAQNEVPITKYHEISRKYGDPWIWGIFIMLMIISIIESYSASSREVAKVGLYAPLIKQCLFLGVGALLAIGLLHVNYNRTWFLYLAVPILAIFSVVSLLYVMKFGDLINGARRSMTIIPGLPSIQPSEFAKLSIVTLLSYILAKSQKNKDITKRGLLWTIIVVSIYCGMMYQSGLTNMLLLFSISASMLLIGGAHVKKFVIFLVFFGFIAGGYIIIKSLNDDKEQLIQEVQASQPGIDREQAEELLATPSGKKEVKREGMRMGRIQKWLRRDSLVYDPITAENQQEMFSRMAQANGGLVGVGVGRSRECSRLPLAFSDYIFSIIVEETGFFGGLFVIALYLSLLGRASMIVRRSKRVLPSLLVIGMASYITFQALFHIAINVGVFPVSGQPLPLISMGGSSMLAICAAFGVMLSVSRTIANQDNKNIKVEEVPIIEGLDAENPTEIPAKNVWK